MQHSMIPVSIYMYMEFHLLVRSYLDMSSNRSDTCRHGCNARNGPVLLHAINIIDLWCTVHDNRTHPFACADPEG